MAKFMDVHSGFVGVTAAQLREAHDRDLAIEHDEGVHFERAWLDPEAGKVFCLATRSVRSRSRSSAIHERAGQPPAEVYELDGRAWPDVGVIAAALARRPGGADVARDARLAGRRRAAWSGNRPRRATMPGQRALKTSVALRSAPDCARSRARHGHRSRRRPSATGRDASRSARSLGRTGGRTDVADGVPALDEQHPVRAGSARPTSIERQGPAADSELE